MYSKVAFTDYLTFETKYLCLIDGRIVLAELILLSMGHTGLFRMRRLVAIAFFLVTEKELFNEKDRERAVQYAHILHAKPLFAIALLEFCVEVMMTTCDRD